MVWITLQSHTSFSSNLSILWSICLSMPLGLRTFSPTWIKNPLEYDLLWGDVAWCDYCLPRVNHLDPDNMLYLIQIMHHFPGEENESFPDTHRWWQSNLWPPRSCHGPTTESGSTDPSCDKRWCDQENGNQVSRGARVVWVGFSRVQLKC